MATAPEDAVGWLQLIGVVGAPLLVFAALFGSLRAEIRALKDDMRRLCGDHTDIAVAKADIVTIKTQLTWGTGQINGLWAALRNVATGATIRRPQPDSPVERVYRAPDGEDR